MVFNHEVVSECSDDRSDVRHDPRDPEEVVARAEGLQTESGHEREEPAKSKMKNWDIFTWGTVWPKLILNRKLNSRRSMGAEFS